MLLTHALLTCGAGALTAGYVNSVITTIEKRFEIGSSFSGLIAASVEVTHTHTQTHTHTRLTALCKRSRRDTTGMDWRFKRTIRASMFWAL